MKTRKVIIFEASDPTRITIKGVGAWKLKAKALTETNKIVHLIVRSYQKQDLSKYCAGMTVQV